MESAPVPPVRRSDLLPALALCALVGTEYLLLFTVPRFELVFQTLGVELPVSTKLVLLASRFSCSVVGLAATLGALGIAGALLFRAAWTERGRRTILVVLLVGALADAAIATSLYVSIAKVREALRKR